MTKDEATKRFVQEHRQDDVRALALQAHRDSDIDLPWALDQIQGWQTARRKLPSWAAIDGIVYPPHLSMEQCSSEQTAIYKCGIVERLPEGSRETLIDLTGGFGVDFAFMAKCFRQAYYVERQGNLCEAASMNFQLLGLDHATVIHAEAESILDAPGRYISPTRPASTLFYLDPARRDNNSARTYAIADCTPNVIELLERIFNMGHRIFIKLSPMLDWHKAVNDLGKPVSQVHIVSVAGECKELLVLMDINHEGEPTIHCVNDGQSFIYRLSQDDQAAAVSDGDGIAYLYEPNASLMKAGCFGVLTRRFPVKAVAVDSHLFVSREPVDGFPGRRFRITAVTTMNKKELGRALSGITCANVAVRNFPMTAQQLRTRLRLRDGGERYIFGTTDAAGHHLLYLCEKL